MGYISYGHCRSCGKAEKLDCGLCFACQAKTASIPEATDEHGLLKEAAVVFVEQSAVANAYCGTDLIHYYGVARSSHLDQLFTFVLCGDVGSLQVARCA